jgi:lipopolysaccharide transport system permease protein
MNNQTTLHRGGTLTVIERRRGWRLPDWKEFYEYRDLFLFLVWRNIKVQYAQSMLGIGWAVIQPLFTMIVFTILFGRLVGVSTDGTPYALFSFVGLVPWTYFASGLTEATQSLVGHSQMIGKVYFPRSVLPLAAIAAKLLDFGIAMVLLCIFMAWYRVVPTVGVLLFPLFILLMVVAAAGLGMWLTALSMQYRDVKYATSFIVQLLMYAAPVAYPASLVPNRLAALYALNPMVAVIEGFRAVLLHTRPIPWNFIGLGTLSASVLAITGCLYFGRKERLFADVA